jgi:hypothetical protein
MNLAFNSTAVEPSRLAESIAAGVRDGGRFAGLFATARTDGSTLVRGVLSDSGELVCIETTLDPDANRYPALTPLVTAAAWYEREIHDLFGIEPVGHPRLDPLVLPLRPHDRRPRPGRFHDSVRTGSLGGLRKRRVPRGDARGGDPSPSHPRVPQAPGT